MTNFLPFRMLPMLSQETGFALPLAERLRLVLLTPFYVALGVSVLASTPLLALASKTSQTAKRIIFYVVLRTIVPSLRYFLDTVPTWLVLTWWLRSSNIAQDEFRVMKDVALGEPTHYGTHKREWVQCLHPCGSARKRTHDRIILYCHGGGHLVSPICTLLRFGDNELTHAKAANCVVLMPSVTPWVRAGFTVFCMNYPLSPETIFPNAVKSVLRCLQWMRREHGVQVCALTGDSAGGNLATMAAALATNKSLLSQLDDWREFSPESEGVQQSAFPIINGVVSMYGLLDRTSFFEKDTPNISRLETALSRFGLDFIYWAYTGDEKFADSVPQPGKPLEGRCTLSDVVEVLESYPKTFLTVGTRDVLVHSSRKAHALLVARGFESELHEYDARHAFIGLPPALNIGGTWRSHSKPATEKIIAFLDALDWKEAEMGNIEA